MPDSDIPLAPTGRRLRARDALLCIGLCALLLVIFEGVSIRRTGDEMSRGWQRTLVLSVGRPAGAVSDATGLGALKDRLVAWAHPDDTISGPGSFEARGAGTAAGAVAPVTPDAFDARSLGAPPRPPRRLQTVLVTGDSLAQPLDSQVARAFARGRAGVRVRRDAHLGTAISQSDVVDWGQLSVAQVRRYRPEAVVMFMGANEGFPMTIAHRALQCCGPGWTAQYSSRVRRMMDTYRQAGAARVYWLNLPGPRSAARQRISRSVNAAIAVAAQPYRAQVRVLDMATLFTPGGRYHEALTIDGTPRIVRQPDGVHLNAQGTRVALAPVLRALRSDFGAAVPR